MVHQDSGLHLHARAKASDEWLRITHADRAMWDAVDSFSLQNMQDIVETNAPVLWYLTLSYVNPSYETDSHICWYQPQNLVCCSFLWLYPI
jgi:hypothetical protein